MTNEHLTMAFSFLAAFVAGHSYFQHQTNRLVSKRIDGLREGFELTAKAFDAQNISNRKLLEVATQQIMAIMDRLPRSRKPPGNG